MPEEPMMTEAQRDENPANCSPKKVRSTIYALKKQIAERK